MNTFGETPPVIRFAIAAAIVFGIPIFGFMFIYSAAFILPLLVLAIAVFLLLRWLTMGK